jgi:hypothetical protein
LPKNGPKSVNVFCYDTELDDYGRTHEKAMTRKSEMIEHTASTGNVFADPGSTSQKSSA